MSSTIYTYFQRKERKVNVLQFLLTSCEDYLKSEMFTGPKTSTVQMFISQSLKIDFSFLKLVFF